MTLANTGRRLLPGITVVLMCTTVPALAQVKPRVMTPETGIRLPDPGLKQGQSVGETDVEGIVKKTVDRINESLRKDTAGMPESTAEVIRETVITNISVGFGPLQSTRRLPDPGPPVGDEDPMVIDFQNQPLFERIINASNLLPVGYLATGVNVARSVARVARKFGGGALPDAGLGTGFMISPTLFMTNNHVIGSPVHAKKFDLQFNFQYADDGSKMLPHVTYEFDPDAVFVTDVALDFTIVQVKPRQRTLDGVTTSVLAGEEFGFVSLSKDYQYSKRQLGNVVQHPNGHHKQIAIHENEIVEIYKSVLRYKADTEPGSSGSPVFNNSWRLIALHHAAGDQDKQTGQWLNNEGVRIDVIIDKLLASHPAVAKQLGL